MMDAATDCLCSSIVSVPRCRESYKAMNKVVARPQLDADSDEESTLRSVENHNHIKLVHQLR